MEKSGQCSWEIRDNIGILTIDNPPQNKLIDPEFINIEKFMQWTAGEKNLRGLIITGNGRHFSGGADKDNLVNSAGDKNLMAAKIKDGAKLLRIIEFLSVPVVAAIKGACFGGGLEIALACHIRVCSSNAMFSFPESGLRLMPGLNGTLRLPKLVGEGDALKLILSGDIVNAETALKLKIADYIAPDDNVVDFSLNLIKHMTDDKEIDVINAIVRSLNNSKILSFENAMEEEMKMFCALAFAEAKRIDSQDK